MPVSFEAAVEIVDATDKAYERLWGGVIYRLTFKAKQQNLSGKYTFTIKY